MVFFYRLLLQRVWLASRERLPFRIPGSAPPFWGLLVLQLLRPDSSNLPCLYSTFCLEYPLVLSRFCFERYVNSKSDYLELLLSVCNIIDKTNALTNALPICTTFIKHQLFISNTTTTKQVRNPKGSKVAREKL